jgi:hypothetical protein
MHQIRRIDQTTARHASPRNRRRFIDHATRA